MRRSVQLIAVSINGWLAGEVAGVGGLWGVRLLVHYK